MNNGNTEQPVPAIHKTGAQQTVEEAYLDYLLMPVVDSGDQPKPVVPEPPVNTAQCSVSESGAQSVEGKARADIIEENNAATGEQIPFACQLFTLAGLKLAMPLSDFTQVLPRPEELMPAVKQQAWILGRMQPAQQVIEIVDLAGLIFNRQQHSASQGTDSYHYSSVILLQDEKTGLPCDNVADMVTVDPDKVCWRSSNSQRLWLAGTVKQDGYALLDINGIMQLLGRR